MRGFSGGAGRLAAVVALAALATACTTTGGAHDATSSPAVHPAVKVSPSPRPALVRWHGPVEEIFVHPLVIHPELAFTDDSLGQGFQDYFVTAREFGALLDQLWQHGWTLVDVHRAAAGNVRVPRGRKPLVLVEDDANYYHYFDGRGLAKKLVVAPDGDVRAELPDGSLTDQDVVPMVEHEVAEHPGFSADGAKGVLAETAYEGLLGEHHPDRPAARARLQALADRLRATGWTFASHTYGHIDLTRTSVPAILTDTAKWKRVAGSTLGPVDVLVYPFGARPTDDGVRALVRAGYPIQLDIDVVAHHEHRDGAIIMSRRHVDGFAFDAPARQRPFYDVAKVRDPRRP